MWWKRKTKESPGVIGNPTEMPAPEAKPLTGIERMELEADEEWRRCVAAAKQKREAEIKQRINQLQAQIAPVQQEIAKLENELDPMWAYYRQQAQCTPQVMHYLHGPEYQVSPSFLSGILGGLGNASALLGD